MAEAAALKLAAFAATLRFDALTVDVIDAARRHLLDTIGVAIRGRAHPNARNSLRAMEAIDGAAGTVAVWGSDRKLSTGYAALVNGIACHVLEFDDTHTDAIVHGSAIIVPVVLALGEQQKANGSDIVAAFVAGWEVAARVGGRGGGVACRPGVTWNVPRARIPHDLDRRRVRRRCRGGTIAEVVGRADGARARARGKSGLRDQ